MNNYELFGLQQFYTQCDGTKLEDLKTWMRLDITEIIDVRVSSVSLFDFFKK